MKLTKKLLAILLTVASLISVFAMAAGAAGVVYYGAATVNVSALNIRSAPSTSASRLGTLSKDTRVAVIDKGDGTWFHINYNGTEGYVSAEYLKDVVTAENFEMTGEITSGDVRMRAKNNTSSDVIGTYQKGTKVDIIGINEYRLAHEDPIEILDVDNTKVRESQIARLKELRANRDEAKVQACLNAITHAVETKTGNLLALAVEAAKARATLGEISDACEKIVGRYKAVIRMNTGVYSSEVKNDSEFETAKKMVAEFAKKEGRQPRIMVAKLGQDGHDRGAKVVATGYADCGFDVDMGPLFQTPEEAARQAVENDVHIVGVSSLAAGHKTLVPQIIAELKKLGREDILVVVGGVIPAQDYDELYRDGAVAIFGPGTPISKAVIKMIELLNQKFED